MSANRKTMFGKSLALTLVALFACGASASNGAKSNGKKSIFVKDYLPDGCIAWAVEKNGIIQDLYRPNNKRLFVSSPCGVLTYPYHSVAVGDKIIATDEPDGRRSTYIYDGDKGLVSVPNNP